VTTLGILGTGHLAALLVRGLAGSGYRIVLSPRNAEVAARLSAEHGCAVGESNQAVVDAADGVVVCLPAATGAKVLADLTFRPDQPVLSAMAGTGLARLQSVIGPARGAVTMLPGYANAYRVGPSILCPDDGFWRAVLAILGPVFPLHDEAQFTIAATFGAFSGASFGWMAHLIGWFQAQGLPPETARALIAATLRGNAEVLLQEDRPLDEIARSVVTPGGISEMVLKILFKGDGMTAWDEGLDAVLRRVKG
jgi:pyrroline-5-carboxylate reductase